MNEFFCCSISLPVFDGFSILKFIQESIFTSEQMNSTRPLDSRSVYNKNNKKLMLSNCGAKKESWVPWTSWRSNQSILKEINPETHWKEWYQGWNSNTLATWCKELTPGKDPDAEKDWRQKESGTEDEMVGWHHWFNRHELGHTPGDGEGQGGLVCYNPWSFRQSDMT